MFSCYFALDIHAIICSNFIDFLIVFIIFKNQLSCGILLSYHVYMKIAVFLFISCLFDNKVPTSLNYLLLCFWYSVHHFTYHRMKFTLFFKARETKL
jgi:hypothetical protein